MKHYHLIFILLISCVCISCRPIEDENHHYSIGFYNGTSADMYVVQSHIYPDTTVRAMGVLTQPEIYKVKGYSSNNEALSLYPPNTFELFFEGDYKGVKIIPSDTLMIFVFDAQKLEKRDSHVRNSLLVRYDLSLKDLQQNNWTLSYPPTESMKKNIKMWPKLK